MRAASASPHAAKCRKMGIEKVDTGGPMVLEAVYYTSRHKISYADAFAAALAKQRHAELVTGDREFPALESEIKIHWLYPREPATSLDKRIEEQLERLVTLPAIWPPHAAPDHMPLPHP